MLFEELLRQKLDDEWKDYILELLHKKRTSPELGKAQRNKKLIEYIGCSLKDMEQEVLSLKEENKTSWDKLNQYFYSVLW